MARRRTGLRVSRSWRMLVLPRVSTRGSGPGCLPVGRGTGFCALGLGCRAARNDRAHAPRCVEQFTLPTSRAISVVPWPTRDPEKRDGPTLSRPLPSAAQGSSRVRGVASCARLGEVDRSMSPMPGTASRKRLRKWPRLPALWLGSRGLRVGQSSSRGPCEPHTPGAYWWCLGQAPLEVGPIA